VRRCLHLHNLRIQLVQLEFRFAQQWQLSWACTQMRRLSADTHPSEEPNRSAKLSFDSYRSTSTAWPLQWSG
jgi:hypothetical protein